MSESKKKTKKSVDWRSIIYREIESEELDYKAAQNWTKLSRRGRSKFVRHCIALANTKGGYIVVGVGEDNAGRPRLYTGLTEKESKSFDPTAVGNFVNKYADPPVDFDIEKPVVDGKRFVVFVVRRFSTTPHVCAHSMDTELRQGVFYIRTAEASSRAAFRASEIHGIIQRALRNQREVLGRMLRGVLYENRQSFDPDEEGFFAEQIRNSRAFFNNKKNLFANAEKTILFEISVSPSEFDSECFTLSELKRTVETSRYTFTDEPFSFLGEIEEAFFTNVALRYFKVEEQTLWQAFKSGLFHYQRLIDKKDNDIDYQDLIKTIPIAVHFIGQYYSELGYDDELLDIRFKLRKVEGVSLSGTAPGGANKYTCRIPEIKVKLQRTVADMASGPAEHSLRIVKEICERFNMPDGKHSSLETDLKEFLEKRNL